MIFISALFAAASMTEVPPTQFKNWSEFEASACVFLCFKTAINLLTSTILTYSISSSKSHEIKFIMLRLVNLPQTKMDKFKTKFLKKNVKNKFRKKREPDRLSGDYSATSSI